MNFLKKQAAGFYLAAITTVFAIAGLVFYYINCNTDYFGNLGVSLSQVVCLAAACVLELVYIIGYERAGSKIYLDLLPVIAGVLLTAALVLFISSRVAGIASIMTFENNAQTMADMKSAVIGMVFCLLAIVFNIIASFFRVVKER